VKVSEQLRPRLAGWHLAQRRHLYVASNYRGITSVASERVRRHDAPVIILHTHVTLNVAFHCSIYFLSSAVAGGDADRSMPLQQAHSNRQHALVR